MKSSTVAAFGAVAIATVGAVSAAQASIVSFDFVALDGSITYTGTSLDVSTALDLDGATLLVSEVGAGDASGLHPFDTVGLSAATSPPSNEIEYGSTPGPLGADVIVSWPSGVDTFTETLTTVKSIDRTTLNEIAVTLTGTLSDTGGTFTDAPVLLMMHATQDFEHTLPPQVTFTNISAASAVPELSTWAMMALGFGGLGYAASRRRRVNISALAA
jgi:hypothetical protein